MKKKNILLITDIPLCKNYTGGIMASQLVRFLLEEKQNVSAFIPWDRNLRPILDGSVINDVDVHEFVRPNEVFDDTVINNKNYNRQLNKLKRQLVDFVKRKNIDVVWCIVQGDVICQLMNYLYDKTDIKYVVEVWDPIEWWCDAHKFSARRTVKTLKAYETLINNANKVLTTSVQMSRFYNKQYSSNCIEIMPPLEKYTNPKGVIKEKDKFKIALTGQIYAKEEFDVLLSALDLLKWNINGKNVELHHFGDWNPYYIDFEKHIDYKDNIVLHGFVKQDDLLSEICCFDALYCPYFFATDDVSQKVSKLSFPSKLVTYLSVPVVSFIHAPSYASPLIFCKDNSCAYTFPTNNPQELAKLLSNVNEKEIAVYLKNAKSVFEKYFTFDSVKRNFMGALDIDYDGQKKLRILEVNNVDLPGRRFNGYDLISHLNSNTVYSGKQIVTYKTSEEKNVLEFYDNEYELNSEWKMLAQESDVLSVHNVLSLTSNILKNNDNFTKSDLVHYHLIHNTKLSLCDLDELFSLKPTVLTIHDPWIFTGRCAYNQECDKCFNGCKNCEFLDNLFPFKIDNCNSMWKLKQKIYNNLDIDIIVSTPYMKDFLEKSPLTSHFKNVHLVPFGIDLNKFKNDLNKDECRREFNIPSDHVVFFLRSQMAMKGTEYIVDALKELEPISNITFLTCDEVGNFKDVKDKFSIVELGHLEDEAMLKAFCACDVFLMPSKGESFGLMAIEAMAASKPVVIFDNTALPSVTFAPECGYLVKNKDSHALMEAIRYLYNNPEERIRRGKLGRELAEANYDINVYHDRILDVYKKAYERQKNKQRVYCKDLVDYDNENVRLLLPKLYKVLSNLMPNNLIPNDFKIDYDMNYKLIDYSDDNVIALINRTNYLYYKYFMDTKSNVTEIYFRSGLNKIKKVLIRWPKLYSFVQKIYRNISKVPKYFYYHSIFYILKEREKVNNIQNALYYQNQRADKLEDELKAINKYLESINKMLREKDENEKK